MTTGTQTAFELEQLKEKATKRLVILTIRLLFITFMFAAAILPFIAGLNSSNQTIEDVIVDHLGPMISTIAFTVIVLIIDYLTPKQKTICGSWSISRVSSWPFCSIGCEPSDRPYRRFLGAYKRRDCFSVSHPPETRCWNNALLLFYFNCIYY